MQGIAADGEAVDFEPEEDDLMDEDADVSASPRAPPLPKLKSAITGGSASSLAAPKKTKGRGFRQETDADRNTRLAASEFDSLASADGIGPQRCLFPFSLCFLFGWLYIFIYVRVMVSLFSVVLVLRS